VIGHGPISVVMNVALADFAAENHNRKIYGNLVWILPSGWPIIPELSA
jgi:hypothetical protein